MRDASPPILLPFPSHPLHPPHPPRLPPSPSPATPPPPPSPLTLSESLILTIVRATATPTNPEERLRRLLTIRVSSYRPEDILMRNVDGLGHSRAYSKEDSSRRSKDLTGLHGRVIYNFHRPRPTLVRGFVPKYRTFPGSSLGTDENRLHTNERPVDRTSLMIALARGAQQERMRVELPTKLVVALTTL
ncbi:hypothetical protein HZH68_004690 [Vespula germanica]|uniref:Uncharacterized protein n=1 Tax=Vespula germanica TaxID=30212 RepID=A0A834KSA4_VESGE|nr:hypothetical protein HZH68_004690 [Vespula germanica]